MMKVFATAALVTAMTTAGFAQTPASPPPDEPPAAPAQDMTPPPAPPPGGPGHHGPKPEGAGFDIRMGDDLGLKVDCGEEPLVACIEAAQPLIDRFGAANSQ